MECIPYLVVAPGSCTRLMLPSRMVSSVERPSAWSPSVLHGHRPAQTQFRGDDPDRQRRAAGASDAPESPPAATSLLRSVPRPAPGGGGGHGPVVLAARSPDVNGRRVAAGPRQVAESDCLCQGEDRCGGLAHLGPTAPGGAHPAGAHDLRDAPGPAGRAPDPAPAGGATDSL